jgi:hypothetical protein
MKKVILFRILFLSVILIMLSCKKENAQNTGEVNSSEQALTSIDKTYQTDEKQNGSENLEVKSVIKFSSKYNSPQIWDYKWNLNKAALYNVQELANGNFMYLIEDEDKNHNSTVFVLVVDKNGKEAAKQKLAIDSKSKYNLYNTLVTVERDGGFTIYIKRQVRSLKESNEDNDEGKLRDRLKEYYIDKIKFNNTYTGYKTESKSMETLLFKSFQEKGLSYIVSADFSIKFLKNKILLYGMTGEPGLNDVPFIAISDLNMNLLHINSFKDYPATKIETIALNADANFYIEGREDSDADGTYYSTHKRFTINENLKLLNDKSDKEPYESVYRGPSAPDTSDEDEEDDSNNAEIEAQEPVKEVKKEETWAKKTFYSDEKEKTLYNLKQKGMFSNKVVFEKTKSDSTALWQISFVFPDNCEVSIYSSQALKLTNGDFVFSLYLTSKSGQKEKSSMAIFVINEEGRLTRQFQTPEYDELNGFEMKETNGKLLTAFVPYNANFVNNEWEYL